MQFCLDKHGEWVAVSASDDENKEEEGGENGGFFGRKNEQHVKKIAKTLADSTTWLDMLNDTKRNAMFQRAIENSTEKITSVKKRNAANGGVVLHVFDVGSGTGLLSLFAAMAATKTGVTVRIYSCEMFLPMFLVGERIVRDNVREKKIPETSSIQMFHTRSEDVDAIAKHELDVLISELLDSALLGEGWLMVLKDVFSRELLRRDHFSIVPSSAKIWVQLLHAEESMLDVDVKKGRAALFGEAITSDGFSRLDVQCHFDSLEKRGRIRAISKHIQVFEIDFTNDKDWGRTEVVRCCCCCSSSSSSSSSLRSLGLEINAVAMFWECDLDGSGAFRLNTFPAQSYRRHWRQVIAPLECPIPLSASEEIPIQVEARIADDCLAFDVKVSGCGDKEKEKKKEMTMKKQKETLIETKQETCREKKIWLHIALANISEFWSSRAPLGDNVCGLNLTKANVLLCAKSVESNSPGYCYQSFKCDLLDELGHRYSTIEEEQTIFLWKSCELFVDDADEKKREEEEKEEEGEEDNKKKLRIDVDAGLEITANHVVFFFSDKSHADEWKTQPVQVARMDQELIGNKFRIIASNLDADEGECIRVLRK